jgi:hypothetical protein
MLSETQCDIWLLKPDAKMSKHLKTDDGIELACSRVLISLECSVNCPKGTAANYKQYASIAFIDDSHASI